MAVETLPPPTPSHEDAARGPAPARGGLRTVRPNRLTIAGLILALTLVSLALRTGRLTFYYWIDEAISVGIASHPLAQLPHLLREDGSPPLYYALLHIWMQVFGRGEVATHWLSLVFALLTVPAAYVGASSLFGRRAGATSAVLAAGVPFLTTYAQETRMYSLLVLLSLLVGVSFTHVFVLRHRRYLPMFSLSLVAALYTHNWALFEALATFLAFLFCVRATPRGRRRLWRDGVIGFGAVAVLFAPWLPTLLYQAQHTGAPWALAPVVWSLSRGFYFIGGGRGATMTIALAAGFGLLAADTGVFQRRGRAPTIRSDHPGERAAGVAVVSLAVLVFGTLLIAWLYAKTTPAWSGRYLGVIVGPLILLVGLGLARARGLGIAALVLACCFWVLDPAPASRDAKSNVATMAHVMSHRVGAGTLVLSTQPEQVPDLAYYLPSVTRFATPLGAVPDPRVVDWRNALTRFAHSSVPGVLAPLIRGLAPGDRVLLVTPTSFAKAPEWMKLMHTDSRSWLRYLNHDRRLRLVTTAAPRQFSANVAVRGYLYRVTGG